MTEIVLRRSSKVAAWWSLLGIGLVSAGVFLVADTNGHPLAWAAAGVFAVPSLYFLVQLVWPGSVQVQLGPGRLLSRWLWRSRSVPWEDVHVAKVRRIFGDPVLVLDVRQPDGDLDRVRIGLPVGADLDRLHAFLGERLGRASRLRPPRSFRPLDL